MELVPTDEISMLGVSLGSDVRSGEFVSRKLVSRLAVAVGRLAEFEDTQSALFLLRTSFGVVRATHFMRTTPLQAWSTQAAEFDAMVRSSVESLLGFLLPGEAYIQACLTPALGGLGLRRTCDHAGPAYSASFRAAKDASGEDWMVPSSVLQFHGTQKEASFLLDQSIHSSLVERAPTLRERRRLLLVTEPHAGAFVTAVPSTEDGTDTVMRPQVFRTAVAYRLGVPVVPSGVLCPLCMHTVDPLGDHAACCTKNGDLIVRHNRVRNLVERFCEEAMLSPVLEKKGILGSTSGRRPGDVTLPLWTGGSALAVDVAVTSPFSTSGLKSERPADSYADHCKHRKYDKSFVGSNHLFCALVLETTGGVSEEGSRFLKMVFRFASRRQDVEHSVYAGRAWARLSCNLQSSVAQSILARSSGWDPLVSSFDVGSPLGPLGSVAAPVSGRGVFGGSGEGIPPFPLLLSVSFFLRLPLFVVFLSFV